VPIGISQQEIADKLNIGRRTVARVKRREFYNCPANDDWGSYSLYIFPREKVAKRERKVMPSSRSGTNSISEIFATLAIFSCMFFLKFLIVLSIERNERKPYGATFLPHWQFCHISTTPRVRGSDTYRKKFQMLEKFPVKNHHPTHTGATNLWTIVLKLVK